MNTQTQHYDILIGVDRDKFWGYNPRTSTLVLTYSGDVAIVDSDPTHACQQVFERHNRDDRPDGKLGPSLSTGDIVHLVGVGYFEVCSIGFKRIDAPDEIVNDRTWSEVFSDWSENVLRPQIKADRGYMNGDVSMNPFANGA